MTAARRAFLALAGVALAAAAVLLGASSASAHAVVVASTPADGSRLDASPAEVVITFDEPVQLVEGSAKVLASSGERADLDDASLTDGDTRLVIGLEPDLPTDSYSVTWRVVSADTHIVSGSIAFGVRMDAGGAASASGDWTSADTAAQVAVGAGYAGIVLCLGVGAMTATMWPAVGRLRRVRALWWSGWGALLAGALVDLLLQGPRATGSGWGGALALDAMTQTLQGSSGRLLVARIVLLVLLGALQRWRDRRWARPLRGVVAVGILLTVAASGHAASGSDAAVAVVATILHLAAMAVWAGGLLLLLVAVLPRLADAGDARAALRRWSLVAFVSVAVLVVTGEYQAWREVQPLPALWSTGYGATLLVKLALVAVAVACALFAQRVVARRRDRHGPDAADDAAVRAAVRRSVRIEAVSLVLVIVVTTVLTALAPASATYGPAAQLTAELEGGSSVEVEVDTTRHGRQELTVQATTADGADLELQGLTATLSSAENGVAAIAVTMVRDGDVWRSEDAVAPVAGEWTLTLSVQVDAAHAYVTSVDYRVW